MRLSEYETLMLHILLVVMRVMRGTDYLLTFVENVKDLTFLLILVSCCIYRRQLKLTKWKRKLSIGELTMYIITSIAIPLYAITYFILLLELN